MIRVKRISYRQGNRTIFTDFNLHIQAKERLVIVGASGTGKSTLLRLIAGFIAPDRGEIYLQDRRVSHASNIEIPPYERELGMVFQDLALWPHLTVEGNIRFGLQMQHVEKSIQTHTIQKMLRLVGLEGYESRAIDTLSGGEQQRIALARSLALSPQILLMDEALSSLDNKRNKILRKEIIALQETLGFTLVYVTHNLEEAKQIATRIVSLDR